MPVNSLRIARRNRKIDGNAGAVPTAAGCRGEWSDRCGPWGARFQRSNQIACRAIQSGVAIRLPLFNYGLPMSIQATQSAGKLREKPPVVALGGEKIPDSSPRGGVITRGLEPLWRRVGQNRFALSENFAMYQAWVGINLGWLAFFFAMARRPSSFDDAVGQEPVAESQG